MLLCAPCPCVRRCDCLAVVDAGGCLESFSPSLLSPPRLFVQDNWSTAGRALSVLPGTGAPYVQ